MSVMCSRGCDRQLRVNVVIAPWWALSRAGAPLIPVSLLVDTSCSRVVKVINVPTVGPEPGVELRGVITRFTVG